MLFTPVDIAFIDTGNHEACLADQALCTRSVFAKVPHLAVSRADVLNADAVDVWRILMPRDIVVACLADRAAISSTRRGCRQSILLGKPHEWR